MDGVYLFWLGIGSSVGKFWKISGLIQKSLALTGNSLVYGVINKSGYKFLFLVFSIRIYFGFVIMYSQA